MSHARPQRGGRTRVLVNGLHAKSGGGVTYLRNMLPRLASDSRIEVHLLIHESQYELFKAVVGQIQLHQRTFPSGGWRLLAWEQVGLPNVARALGADVTLSPANFGPLFAPKPVIVLRNALGVADNERRPLKRLYWIALGLMTRMSLIRCRRAIAVSDYARHALAVSRSGCSARKVSVIYHGVDARFTPGAASSPEARYLLAVSDLYVQKNLHTLIAALPRIRQQCPEIVLRIAGARLDDGYFRTLQQAVARNGVEDAVAFLGPRSVDELVALYRGCAVFVFPSTVETFGNPLVEAMACGAPIASSNTAAMPEVVGDAAVLFNPQDPEDLARAVLSILRDQALAETLCRRGLERVRAFSWESTARQTVDVLLDAAGAIDHQHCQVV